MQIKNKVYKPLIAGLLAVTLGMGFSSNAYAQQKKLSPVIKHLISDKVLTQQAQSIDLTNLPPVVFYSPETDEEEVLDLTSNAPESVEPLSPIAGEEEDGNLSEDNLSAPAALETFSGQSDLRKITNSKIILLEIEMGSKKSKKKSYGYCSGAMISRYTVLTAAHCLRALKKGGTIKAYAGGKKARYTSYKKETWYPKLFTQLIPAIDFQVDYGYVVLNDPLGDYVGAFGGRNPILIVGDSINAVGFPACSSQDRPSVSKGKKIALPNGDLFQLLLSLFDKYGSFKHSAYIDNGMSGGPIFQGSTQGNIIAVTSNFIAPFGKKRQLWATGSGLGRIKGLISERRDKEAKNGNGKSSKSRSRRSK